MDVHITAQDVITKKHKTLIMEKNFTRMKSSKPKVLHEIFSKPLVGWVVDAINDIYPQNNTQSIVVVGHGANEVENYLKKYENVTCALQKEQLGTGHAVSMAAAVLKDFCGTLLITCGDTPLLKASTMRAMVEYHLEHNADVTVMSAIFENPYGYGRIVRAQDGSIEAIVEQKDANNEQKAIKEINAGVYCLKWESVKDAFGELKNNNSQGEYYLTDIIGWGKKNNLNVHAYILENSDEIFGINSRKHLAEAARIMNERKLAELMDNGVTIVDTSNTWISEDTEIGQDTIIYPFTYIEGKNKIGKNCKIGPCAHLRGDVEIQDNCKIGNFVEVKKARIGHNTNAGHLSYIGDSELGSHVNIGAGTITANFDPISRTKNKTVLKDHVKIGSNTVLVAPVEVGEGTNVGAGSVITKNLGEWTLALTRAPLRIIEGWVKKKN